MSVDDPLLGSLSEHLDDTVAADLLARLCNFSNDPNTIKGAAKMPGHPEVESAARAVIDESSDLVVIRGSGFTMVTQQGWGLLTLAARADITLLDRVAEMLDSEGDHKKLAMIRRAATKHAAAPGPSGAGASDDPAQSATPATSDDRRGADAVQPPTKVSEVKAWIGSHGDGDPAVLAPYQKQKAAARSAAIRALGLIGTDAALQVLGRYAQGAYPDGVLTELHRAWGSFDRREFAATMFRPNAYTLDLGTCSSVEGIEAVEALTSVDVVLTPRADLAPFAGCTGLRTLRVGAEGFPGLLSIEPLLGLAELTELHLTRTTRNATLTPLADLPVRRLRLDLDGAAGEVLLEMPALQRVLLSGGHTSEDGLSHTSVEPRPADPCLPSVVHELVARGVDVVVWAHERSWVKGLVDRAEAEGTAHLVKHGRVALTSDASRLPDLESRMWGNRLP